MTSHGRLRRRSGTVSTSALALLLVIVIIPVFIGSSSASAGDESCRSTEEGPDVGVTGEVTAYLSSLPSPPGSSTADVDGVGGTYTKTVRSAIGAFDRSVGGSNISSESLPSSWSRGESAYALFSALASSQSFRTEYWRKKPLLLRADDLLTHPPIKKSEIDNSNIIGIAQEQNWDPLWADGSFTPRHLRLIDGSYISGQRTSDELRDGRKNDRWEGNVNIKDDPKRRTRWSDVVSALKGGTVFFNHAGLSFPGPAALCRLATAAFGLPSNANVYVTPLNRTMSIPPHTDRQDVLIVQTAGSKRWKVWSPPSPRKMGVDPFNRGKGGDVITAEELGDRPLVDAVVRAGDLLYVPAGFPHGTDTVVAEKEASKTVAGTSGSDDAAPERRTKKTTTSIHITVGLDTNVWGLTFIHLRQMVLGRSGKDPRLGALANVDEEASWEATGAAPVGFLLQRGGDGDGGGDSVCKNGRLRRSASHAKEFVGELKQAIIRLEPNRWKIGSDNSDEMNNNNGRDEGDVIGIDGEAERLSQNPRIVWRNRPGEALPPEGDFYAAAEFVLCLHLPEALRAQEKMYSRVTNPRDDATLLEMRRLSEQQNQIMKRFGEFSKPAPRRTDRGENDFSDDVRKEGKLK